MWDSIPGKCRNCQDEILPAPEWTTVQRWMRANSLSVTHTACVCGRLPRLVWSCWDLMDHVVAWSAWLLHMLKALACSLIMCYVFVLICFLWIITQVPDQRPGVLLLCVVKMFLISVCHVSRCFVASPCASYSPAVMISAVNGSY